MISVGRSVGTEGSHVVSAPRGTFFPSLAAAVFDAKWSGGQKWPRSRGLRGGKMSGGKVGFSHRPIRKSREMAVQAYYGRSTEYLKISSVVNVIYEKNQVHSINVWSFPLTKI